MNEDVTKSPLFQSLLLSIRVGSGLAMGFWSDEQCAEYFASNKHQDNRSYLLHIISSWGNVSRQAEPCWYLNEILKNGDLIYSSINWGAVNAFAERCVGINHRAVESEKEFFKEKYPYLYREVEKIKQSMLEPGLLSNSAITEPVVPQTKDKDTQKNRASKIDSDLLALASHELRNGSGFSKFKRKMHESYALHNENAKPTEDNTYYISEALLLIYVLKSEDCNTLHYSVPAENNKTLIQKIIKFTSLERYFRKYQKTST